MAYRQSLIDGRHVTERMSLEVFREAKVFPHVKVHVLRALKTWLRQALSSNYTCGMAKLECQIKCEDCHRGQRPLKVIGCVLVKPDNALVVYVHFVDFC